MGRTKKESGEGMSCSCAPSAHDEMCLVIEMLLEGRRFKHCLPLKHCELAESIARGRGGRNQDINSSHYDGSRYTLFTTKKARYQHMARVIKLDLAAIFVWKRCY
ncbi:hypothetical protein CEXT_96861 [Caerostris extrusa]|uniref:Uncharacterized protein n=1 Tax=Caerostris extrusa TaxID=172846 RepID=A0AAV4NNR7_CAEEX|nr:hypothetical protein CEXT_96861 [Caerostris extrusa]